jgi:hypothetical protein
MVDIRHPCWRGYLELISTLGETEFPESSDLNKLLPDGLANVQGKTIRFVPASRLPGVNYERHIFETGEVSTRRESWHDLFNALVWCRWPSLKVAMNDMHCRHMMEDCGGRRGAVRDALTLFDESGAIVWSSDSRFLQALARRDWTSAFRAQAEFGVLITGHALLEKFVAPYKSITAHVVLLHVDSEIRNPDEEARFRVLDRALADRLLSERLFMMPADLSPLPLMGMPGWWTGPQDVDFYSDRGVFRPPPAGFAPSPVFNL